MSVSLSFFSASLTCNFMFVGCEEEWKCKALVGERGHHPFPYLETSMALMGACHVYLLLSEEKPVARKAWARKFAAFRFLFLFSPPKK